MKHIYLIRHAKSRWNDDGLQDHERPLGKRGREQLEWMRKAIRPTGALEGPVFCSHAVRARETLQGLIRGGPRPAIHGDRMLYTFDAQVLVDWLRARKDEDRMTLIGHNPALEELADYLCRESPGRFPTCAFMHISLRIKHWSELAENTGRLETFLRPRDVSYKEFNRKRKKIPGRQGRPLHRYIPQTLQHLYQRMRDLEAGVILGIDDEFLHQYRIAIRRSRAIAESVSELGGDSDLRKVLKALKKHARATSLLRDIHVLLADLETWPLKKQTRAATVVSGIRNHFAKRAGIEHQKLIQHLNGRKYRNSMDDWRQRIHARPFESMIRHLTRDDIRQALEKRLRRYNKRTRNLGPESPDDEIHALRKLLKRIRYLADLDKPVFRDLRKPLAYRQQIFGTFQDLCVQRKLLQAYRDELATTSGKRKPPAGLNHLIDGLAAEKQKIRNEILTLGEVEGTSMREA